MALRRLAARSASLTARSAPAPVVRCRPAAPILALSRNCCPANISGSRRCYATEGSAPPVATSTAAQSSAVRQADKAANTQQETTTLSKTPLYDLHIRHGAKMVPFAGFEMPLTYRWGGQLAEHHQVRKQAGIFDVSHMVQSTVSGPGATDFLLHLLPTSLESLKFSQADNPYAKNEAVQGGPYKGSLSLLLNKDGGIIDDLIVTRQGEESYYIVTNAGRRKEDLTHITKELKAFNKQNGTDVQHQVIDNGLIALQGPAAAAALQAHLPSVDLSKLYFGQSLHASLAGVDVHIARGGYTGEDGFEISIPKEKSIELTERLLSAANGEVQLVGLAARDSLRLEAGMCLYGHDLSEDVGAVEAGLTWVVGEDRRTGTPFIGSSPTLSAMAAKSPSQKRVGLLIEPGLVAREGTPIYAPGLPVDPNDPLKGSVGRITSGIPSPTLKQNIAMGYVEFGKYHKLGTELEVRLRGKTRKAKVVRMPFVKSNYWRGP